MNAGCVLSQLLLDHSSETSVSHSNIMMFNSMERQKECVSRQQQLCADIRTIIESMFIHSLSSTITFSSHPKCKYASEYNISALISEHEQRCVCRARPPVPCECKKKKKKCCRNRSTCNSFPLVSAPVDGLPVPCPRITAQQLSGVQSEGKHRMQSD